MKNIFILSMTLLIVSVFTACNKKRCWDCKVYRIYQSTPDASPTLDSSYRACDLTKDEMNKRSYEARSDSGFINTQGSPDTMMKRHSCQKVKNDPFDQDIWPHF